MFPSRDLDLLVFWYLKIKNEERSVLSSSPAQDCGLPSIWKPQLQCHQDPPPPEVILATTFQGPLLCCVEDT